MKTIVLIELFWTGHHPTYLKLFTATLLKLGCRVQVLCPEPGELHDWIADNCKEKISFLEVYEYRKPELSQFPQGRILSAIMMLKRWKTAAKAVKKIAADAHTIPDLVFFTYLDVYLNKFIPYQLIDRIFTFKWSGLYFAPYQLRLPVTQKDILFRLNPLDRDSVFKAKHCHAVTVLDEGVISKLQAKLKGKSVISFPDFADVSSPDYDYEVANLVKEKAGSRTVIGLLGHIDKRKGLLTLMEVAEKTADKNYFFVVAGKFIESSFTKQELGIISRYRNSNPTNCFFHLEFIPDEPSFNALVACCDIIFAAYERFYYSSNLLTKAAYFC